jgi:hypothetical protein
MLQQQEQTFIMLHTQHLDRKRNEQQAANQQRMAEQYLVQLERNSDMLMQIGEKISEAALKVVDQEDTAMNSACVALFALLLQQQDSLHLTVKAEYGGRLVGVLFAGHTEERLAWLCERSSEYHQHRVRALDVNHIVSLVICRKHDSVLPVPVIDLVAHHKCDAFQSPHWYQPEMRATKRGSSVFLGQLICGITSAYDQLAALPPSTQRRYRAKVKRQARGRRGRPIKLPREESPAAS